MGVSIVSVLSFLIFRFLNCTVSFLAKEERRVLSRMEMEMEMLDQDGGQTTPVKMKNCRVQIDSHDQLLIVHLRGE